MHQRTLYAHEMIVRVPYVLLGVCFVLAAACDPAPNPKGASYPAREVGCEVKVFNDAPSGNTDNIGPVSAKCTADISKDDCMRTLKDQACKVGADILWGVNEQAEQKDGKTYFYGRAAHSK